MNEIERREERRVRWTEMAKIRGERERKDEIGGYTPRSPYYLRAALVYIGHDPVTHITMCHRLNLIHDRWPS